MHYLTAESVAAMNEDILGQVDTVLNWDILESALQRPRNLAYYENADLITGRISVYGRGGSTRVY